MPAVTLTEATTLYGAMFNLTSDESIVQARLTFRGWYGSQQVQVVIPMDIPAGTDLDMTSTDVVTALDAALLSAGYANP